jgi:DNA-3-methyladenine glycosylase II
MSTPHYKKVRRHLSDNCPVMKRIIDRVGPCTLTPNRRDPFTFLVRAVISQQISTKSAESISGRLVALVGDGSSGAIPLAKLATLTDEGFRSCGISAPKQRTIRAVVGHVQANPDLLPNVAGLDDETIREHLTSIKGIGPWTADMFLLFALGRPDIWPVGDYGVKVAVRAQFKLRKMPDAARLTKIARPWEPHRSVAVWYLWRSLEPQFQDE